MTTTTLPAAKPATFTERNNWLRESLAGRIEVLVPDETDPETRRLYAEEKADYAEAGQ